MSFNAWWGQRGRELAKEDLRERLKGGQHCGTPHQPGYMLAEEAYYRGIEVASNRNDGIVGLLKALGTAGIERATAQVGWLQKEAEKGRSLERVLMSLHCNDATEAAREIERLRKRK